MLGEQDPIANDESMEASQLHTLPKSNGAGWLCT
jgi:hypothetical protein